MPQQRPVYLDDNGNPIEDKGPVFLDDDGNPITPMASHEPAKTTTTTQDVLSYLKEAAGNLPASALKNALAMGELATGDPIKKAVEMATAPGGVVAGLKGIGSGIAERVMHPLDTLKNDPVGAAMDVAGGVGLAGDASRAVGRGLTTLGNREMRSVYRPSASLERKNPGIEMPQTANELGLNPTAGGREKNVNVLRGLRAQKIANRDAATQGGAAVDMQASLDPVYDLLDEMHANRPADHADVRAVESYIQEQLTHPTYGTPAARGGPVPLNNAESMKQYIGRQLDSLRGTPEAGSARAQAMDAHRRGLRQQLETAVPGTADINAQMAPRIAVRKAQDDAIRRHGNERTPLLTPRSGAGAAIGSAIGGAFGHPVIGGVAGATIANNPGFRGATARALYSSGRGAGAVGGAIPEWLTALLAQIAARDESGQPE